MNNKHILSAIAGVLIVGAVAFYGGTLYAKTKTPGGNRGGMGMAFNGQMRGMGQGGMNGSRALQQNGGFSAGEIVFKDDKSITIKMGDGGSSKIVFVASSTTIGKMAPATMDDLAQGTNVVVTGAANADGSITANSIQIRPAGAPGVMRFGGMMR